MKKKELLQKVRQIDENLTALGNLQDLVQRASSLPGLISDADTKKRDIESFLVNLPAQNEKLQNLISDVQKLETQLITRKKEVGDLVTSAKDLQEKATSLNQEILVQLGEIANEKLANSFFQVKQELLNEKEKWFNWLVYSVVALVAATIAVAVWQILQEKTILELGFLIRVALTSPIVYFVIFVNREYSRVRGLIEEYAFKASIARSFEAYKDIIENIFSDQQTSIFQQKLDFVLNAVSELYSSPMKNIKENHIKEKENSPDLFSKTRAVLSETVKKNIGQ